MKTQLSQLKNKYLVTIYDGLSKEKSVKNIHKQLLEDTLNSKVKNAEMLKLANHYTRSIKKLLTKNTVNLVYNGLLSVAVFDLLKKKDLEKKMSHQIVKQADKIEGEEKDKVVKDNLEKNRHLENPKIFYLSSWHKDSASDHAPFQGKIYVDVKWQNFIKDKELKEQIAKYISSNDVKTLQWVLGAPVWFMTRPNCRHYFKELSVEEVLNNSADSLLKTFNMRTAVGDRQYLQTLKIAKSKNKQEEIRNAELLLKSYKERLSLHTEMWKANPNDVLKAAIKKDLALVRKWQIFIKNEKNKLT